MKTEAYIENFEEAFRVIEDLDLQGDHLDLENLRDPEVAYQGYRYRKLTSYGDTLWLRNPSPSHLRG